MTTERNAKGERSVLHDKKKAPNNQMNSIPGIAGSRASGAKSRGPVTAAGRLSALANSAKSTGPVTQAGRERSAQHAIRHGILAETYVETMALAEWRRLRLICLEKERLAIETQRQVRRREREKLRKSVKQQRPKTTDLRENVTNENAERSEPNIGEIRRKSS